MGNKIINSFKKDNKNNFFFHFFRHNILNIIFHKTVRASYFFLVTFCLYFDFNT